MESSNHQFYFLSAPETRRGEKQLTRKGNGNHLIYYTITYCSNTVDPTEYLKRHAKNSIKVNYYLIKKQKKIKHSFVRQKDFSDKNPGNRRSQRVWR